MKLSDAVRVQKRFTRGNGVTVYSALVDAEFTIGVAPHGGYLAALLLNCLILHQSTTSHNDIAHCTYSFLTASAVGEAHVEVTPVSVSKRWTRLDVSFFQGGKLRIRMHAIFTNLPLIKSSLGPPSPDNLTLMPYSDTPFAQPSPFFVHPSVLAVIPFPPAFQFSKRAKWTTIRANDDEKKTEWKGYLELIDDPAMDVTGVNGAVLLAFFGDLFRNGFERLPKEQQAVDVWLPTLHYTLDFKAKFPLDFNTKLPTLSPALASATIASKCHTDYLLDGRYCSTVELWSAPSSIGAARTDSGEDWRNSQTILCVSSQVALMVPFGKVQSKMQKL